MSALALTLSTTMAAERSRAIRLLLRHPLLTADAQGKALLEPVVKHRDWLIRWFSEHAGWRLVVDGEAGFARLYKIPPAFAAPRSAEARSGAFDRRRYVLLCLLLAALDDVAGQTTLATLASALKEQAMALPGVEPFDPDRRSERRAFVDALRWLVDLGVLRERDGALGRYAESGQGDALYDLDERLLNHLIAAPHPPALAGDPGRMMHEPAPETQEGQRRAARQHVFRQLLDEPVLYTQELDADTAAWLGSAASFVHRTLREAGFLVERRAEGLAAIDPEGLSSDLAFPAGDSSHKHAALLLAELWTARVREGRGEEIDQNELLGLVHTLVADLGDRCGWRADYRDPAGGAERLLTDATQLLFGLGLIQPTATGWAARPAIARFAPAQPGAMS